MNITIKKVDSSDDLQKCFDIRTEVFIRGQNVPIDEEMDGKDAMSEHYLLLADHIPVGVARVRLLNEVAKIERVAILESYQGKGLGKHIMLKILADLKMQPKVTTALLSAQTYAIPFYEKLKFEICSQEYMDAGIPHKDMKLSLVNIDL